MHLSRLKKRIILEKSIRLFFWDLGYEEVRTPMLVKSPGMEPHIFPLQLLRNPDEPASFLPTSPEFGMKKLLASGLPKIFQICPAFRNEPRSPEHHPEFTMLEFYESNLPLTGLQERVEDLLRALCISIHGTAEFRYQGTQISLQPTWKRFRVVDLFKEHLGIDLRTHQESKDLAKLCQTHALHASETESWDDLYFKLWLNLIEPKLPTNAAFFITHYPLSQSSLCNPILDEEGFAWANRFEVYIGRTELGNAFDELRDPSLQRKNFVHDQEVRTKTYGDRYPTSPLDEELLQAIGKMQPTSGIAMGIDRICMLLLDAKTINEVLFLQSHW
jgi:lysyl-tRNA synthetase class 2